MLRIGDSSDENFPLSVGGHRQRFPNPFSRREGAFAFQNVPAPRAPRLAHYERRLQYFWEISNYDLTPRTGKDFKREVEVGRSVLRSFRRSLPRARITWDREQPRIPAAMSAVGLISIKLSEMVLTPQ